MKRHNSLILNLLLAIISLTTSVYGQTIDPIKFSISTEALQVGTNEEFEMTITARYITVPSSAAFVFEGANAYRLNLVMPEGFKQTGGDFYNSTTGELSKSKPTITYKIKGKFTDTNNGGTFQLLRSHKNADDQSKFVQVGKLAFASMQSDDLTKDETKRLAVIPPVGYIPYLTINQLRAGSADTAKAVYITDDGRFGLFRIDLSDTSTPDDSSLVLVYSTKRFKRVCDFVTPEMFGAKGDGLSDDTPFLRKAIRPGRKVVLKGKYLVTSSVHVALNNSQYVNISGVDNAEIIFNGYFPCLEFTSTTDSGRVNIENVRITGTMPFILDDVRFAVGIQTNRIDAISITNCSFNKIYGNGIFLIDTKGASKVSGNSFINCGGLNPNYDGDLLDHYGDGITVWNNCKNVLISSNTIHFDATKIGYYGRCGIVFDNNSAGTIENNTVSGYSRGLHIEYNTVGSSVYGNRVTGSASALILSQSSYNRITDNYFSNENSPKVQYVAADYFISNYGDNSRNVFINNIILVDTSLDKSKYRIPEMIHTVQVKTIYLKRILLKEHEFTFMERQVMYSQIIQ